MVYLFVLLYNLHNLGRIIFSTNFVCLTLFPILSSIYRLMMGQNLSKAKKFRFPMFFVLDFDDYVLESSMVFFGGVHFGSPHNFLFTIPSSSGVKIWQLM